jgi:hypothetical protein
VQKDVVTPSGPVTVDERTTSERLRINPKHHIAAVVAVGWDFAKETQYFKGDSTPDDPNDDADTIIDSREVSEGATLYVGAQWMVGGVDYHNMRWWNYWANLFVAVNAVAPLDDFAIGLALTPTGGISLAVGPTFHKRTWLDDGFTDGQIFNDDGNIPTNRRWQGPVVGAFLGLTIDSNVFKALKAVSYD